MAEQQTRKQMQKRIKLSSNTKILRRQLELLAEYSRLKEGIDAIPECSKAMASIYRELVKAKCWSLGFLTVLSVVLGHFVQRFFVRD